MDSFTRFLHGVEATGQRLNDDEIKAFGRYLNEIRRVNQLLGLVSRNDLDRIPLRHFLDALTPALMGLLPADGKMLDIGSGGGLPGIPLAILMPDTQFVLIESNRRKSTFLSKMRRELMLDNVTVKLARVESIPKPSELYDGAVARAVASVSRLVTWSGRMLKPGGKLVCYKGPKPEEEIESARAVLEEEKMVLEDIYRYHEDVSESPTLVVLRKL